MRNGNCFAPERRPNAGPVAWLARFTQFPYASRRDAVNLILSHTRSLATRSPSSFFDLSAHHAAATSSCIRRHGETSMLLSTVRQPLPNHLSPPSFPPHLPTSSGCEAAGYAWRHTAWRARGVNCVWRPRSEMLDRLGSCNRQKFSVAGHGRARRRRRAREEDARMLQPWWPYAGTCMCSSCMCYNDDAMLEDGSYKLEGGKPPATGSFLFLLEPYIVFAVNMLFVCWNHVLFG